MLTAICKGWTVGAKDLINPWMPSSLPTFAVSSLKHTLPCGLTWGGSITHTVEMNAAGESLFR